MTETEWADLVDELNVSYPHQQIDPLTARSWYRSLRDYTFAEMWRALERCGREREFISSYALAEAVRDERRERSATRSTVLPLPARGVGMPPETKEAIEVLKRSKLLPDDPNYLSGPEARRRCDELASYLDARLAERSTAPLRNGGRP